MSLKNAEKKTFTRKKIDKFNKMALIAFFTGVLLIISTYAWFSVNVNVKVENFDVVVASDSGIFISIDGVNFSNSVIVSRETVITNLFDLYPNHINQWATGGMWPISTNGIRDNNMHLFDLYEGDVRGYVYGRRTENIRLNTRRIIEDRPSSNNVYLAFDIFLKNVSGSPNPDNLYLVGGSGVFFSEGTDEEELDEQSFGIMNSTRLGFLKVGSVPLNSSVEAIQSVTCSNNCISKIYEPNHLNHSELSIERAFEYYGITLVDGEYTPTFAVIDEGEDLDLENGHEETGIPLDEEHFALQETITDDNFYEPLFQIPNAITKVRVYVWIEGQDLDSLETRSRGLSIDVVINLEKDLAGYEVE